MPDCDNQDQQPVVMDLVDDSVVTRPHTPLSRPAHHRRCLRRSWVKGKQTNGRLDASPSSRVQFSHLPLSSGQDVN